jgi:RNA polymerase sigma-70 factor (ECF subfamily)
MLSSDSVGPEGKRARFEAAAIPLMKHVLNAARYLAHSPEDARDLAQETYLRAYRTFENFRPGTNCKAWLFTILYSIFVNRYRKQQREPKTIPVEELEEKFHRSLHAAEERAPSRNSDGTLRWSDADIAAALNELPEDFRAAVLMVDVEELTYEETARALDCPIGTVRSRLSRARKLLYTSLEDRARREGYLKDGPRPGATARRT